MPAQEQAVELGLLDAVAQLPAPVWLVLAVAFSLGSVALGVWLLTQLPADHLLRSPELEPWSLRRVARNLVGASLVVVGGLLALPGVPGQGLLTIACGLLLMDVPGKRGIERRLLRHPSVRDAVTALRARYGKPPLLLPQVDDVPRKG